MKNKKPNKPKVDKIDPFEYQINIVFDPRDNIFVARVPELENCHSHGNSPEQALAKAKEAIILWIESAKKKKIHIPKPMTRKNYSGKFVLRTTEELHAILASYALHMGKSMNDFVIELIAKGLKKTG